MFCLVMREEKKNGEKRNNSLLLYCFKNCFIQVKFVFIS